MGRILAIAAAWALLTWNVIGLAAFRLEVDAGALGVVAGLAVAAAIALVGGLRTRAVHAASSSRSRAEA